MFSFDGKIVRSVLGAVVVRHLGGSVTTVVCHCVSVVAGRHALSYLTTIARTRAIATSASTALDALCLLVVIEVSGSSSHLLNTLMVNIVDLDDVVDQVMMIVVVIVDYSDQVVVVSVHIVNDVAVVLVMNVVLLDNRLGQVVVELNRLVDWRLVGDQIARLTLAHGRRLKAAHVRGRELDAREVQAAWSGLLAVAREVVAPLRISNGYLRVSLLANGINEID